MTNIKEAQADEVDAALRKLFTELEGEPFVRGRPAATIRTRLAVRPVLSIAITAVVLVSVGYAAFRLGDSGERSQSTANPASTGEPASTGASCIASIDFRGSIYFGSRLQKALPQAEELGSATVPACGDSAASSTTDVAAVEGIDPAVAVAGAAEPGTLYILGGRCARFVEGADLISCLRERLSFQGRTYRATRITSSAAPMTDTGPGQLVGETAPTSSREVAVSGIAGIDPVNAVALPDGEVYVADGRCEVWGIPRVLACLRNL